MGIYQIHIGEEFAVAGSTTIEVEASTEVEAVKIAKDAVLKGDYTDSRIVSRSDTELHQEELFRLEGDTLVESTNISMLVPPPLQIGDWVGDDYNVFGILVDRDETEAVVYDPKSGKSKKYGLSELVKMANNIAIKILIIGDDAEVRRSMTDGLVSYQNALVEKYSQLVWE